MKREDVLKPEIFPNSGRPAVAEAVEKRQHPRVPVSVGVEIVETGTQMRITGRATDLGVGGCYVDTTSTFAEGTPVDIFLYWQGRKLHLLALVSYAATGRNSGMGLSFTGASTEAGVTLLDWLTELGGSALVEPAGRAEPKDATHVKSQPDRRSHDLKEVVLELVELLLHKELLTETEAEQLRRRLSEQ